ncbi:MAG: hypothetical protein CNE89_10975 [Sphingomonadaceae bacterium MED-G03]|nr:MAG: hypothetical protein CNE89_10975 [Sphingomonadaceae bacterium MED-G03]
MDEKVRLLALKFRRALDMVAPAVWKDCLIDSFPQGACGHASELFARYLTQELGIEPTYASGEIGHLLDGEAAKHAWLDHNGLVIDLTADQFLLEPVIVSRSSHFHTAAVEVERHQILNDGWFAENAAPVWFAALVLLDQPL